MNEQAWMADRFEENRTHLRAGAVWAPGGTPRVAFGFKIMRGKIVEIDILADPARLRQVDVTHAALPPS
jgi:hypothetical protein